MPHTSERYTISLLNNIQNFDHFMAIQVHQVYFLLTLRIKMDINISGMKTLVIMLYRKYGAVYYARVWYC